MVMCGHKLASNYKAGLQLSSVFNDTVWDSCLCLAEEAVQPNCWLNTRRWKKKKKTFIHSCWKLFRKFQKLNFGNFSTVSPITKNLSLVLVHVI